MRSILSALFFLLVTIGLSIGCGGESPEEDREFRLSEVQAKDLSVKGMGKDFTGDTSSLSSPGVQVLSPESSKTAWCEGRVLYVADADGSTQQALHTESEDSSVFACFGPSWGIDGKTIRFKEARRIPGDSVIQVVTVDITLGRSEEE